MKKYIVTILFFLLIGFVQAGSAVAYLTCKSESGRTLFEAEIQDINGTFQFARFTIDSQSITFKYDMTDCFVIFDEKNGVYTIHIQDKTLSNSPDGNALEFWAIPSTFSVEGYGIYKFDAYIKANDPRESKAADWSKLKLHCVLKYQI